MVASGSAFVGLTLVLGVPSVMNMGPAAIKLGIDKDDAYSSYHPLSPLWADKP